MSCAAVISVEGQPDEELGQTVRVEVEERIGEATRYRMKYQLAADAGDFPLLADDRVGPGTAMSVTVPSDGPMGTCLVRGPVTGHRLELRHGTGGSWVEVQGMDTSVVMDREARSTMWSAVTDSEAVGTIVAGYGYVPDIESTAARHLDSAHALVQRESDLRFIRRLARRNGAAFWVTTDATTGVETAHFKRLGSHMAPDVALAVNVDPPSLDRIEISWDVERPTSVTASQLDLAGVSAFDGNVAASPVAPLGARGLAAITGDTRSIHLAAPADDAGGLQARGEAALIESDFFVRATGSTSRSRLGAVLRAHDVVELQGAGSLHSGSWIVSSVSHRIEGEGHRMEFELIRNAWGA